MIWLERLRALAALVSPEASVSEADAGGFILITPRGTVGAGAVSLAQWMLFALEVDEEQAAHALSRAEALGEVEALGLAQAAHDEAKRRLREGRAIAAEGGAT